MKKFIGVYQSGDGVSQDVLIYAAGFEEATVKLAEMCAEAGALYVDVHEA